MTYQLVILSFGTIFAHDSGWRYSLVNVAALVLQAVLEKKEFVACHNFHLYMLDVHV